jgi:hypothetical protein
MIIIDYNQLAIANIIGGIEGELDENYIRHMILNSIRGYIKKYKKTYGTKVILACDGKRCWRHDYFPYYKANRKKARENSKYNWDFIYSTMAKIRDELKEWSPFYVVHDDNFEGDDIIYCIATTYKDEKVVVISSDKDFIFIHRKRKIKQISPLTKKEIAYKEPYRAGLELVIQGDRIDGIPNILSPDDTFVTGKRQRSITKAKLNLWLDLRGRGICDKTTIQFYKRNRKLINLMNIPAIERLKILNQYERLKPAPANKFVRYLAAKKATLLFKAIGDFF